MPFKTFPKLSKLSVAIAKANQMVPLGAITAEAKRLGSMLCTIDHASEQLQEEPKSPELAKALDAHCDEHGLSWDQYDDTTLVFTRDTPAAAATAPRVAKP